MSAQREYLLCFDERPGALAPGVRPNVTGWYWCQRAGRAAPECLYFESRASVKGGAWLYGVNTGPDGFQFASSDYDKGDTKWFGPVFPPPAEGFW